MDKVILIDGVDVSECEHYRAEIETKMPYGEYEIQKDKCYYSSIEVIQKCKGNKGCIYKQLQRVKAELKKYEDMAKKGLEEFKDVGGCWGCGLQLQLNQDIEDIKKLKAENERLKEENKQLKKLKFKSDGIELLQDANLNLHNANVKYRQALQEIREIAGSIIGNANAIYTDFYNKLSDILDKINEVIGAEE